MMDILSTLRYVYAREHDSDYTMVEGWSQLSAIYTAPNGWKISDFQPSANSITEGDITEHGQINYNRPAGEVVSVFHVWGDRDDDEAGTYTHVVADWRELHITLNKQNQNGHNCRPPVLLAHFDSLTVVVQKICLRNKISVNLHK
jgi:hypothetical protein